LIFSSFTAAAAFFDYFFWLKKKSNSGVGAEAPQR
jgi:hypothetical protein